MDVLPPASSAAADAGDPGFTMPSLVEAAAAEKYWKAKQAELDYQVATRELVPAREIEQRLVDTFTRCRTKLLGITSKTKSALPHLTHTDVVTIDRLVREALEDLATSDTTDAGTAA